MSENPPSAKKKRFLPCAVAKFLTLLLPLLSLVISTNALACKCLPELFKNIKPSYDNADYVFLAKSTSVTNYTIDQWPHNYNRAFFVISKQWKGKKSLSIEVNASAMDSSCGYIFQAKTDYLVFAMRNKKDNTITTDACSGITTTKSPIFKERMRQLEAVDAKK